LISHYTFNVIPAEPSVSTAKIKEKCVRNALNLVTPGAFTMAPENQVRSYHLSGHLEAHLEIGASLVTHLNGNLAIEIDGSW
jgi:hypothetical protein